MEESEVPLEHLHEEIHHSAEHSRERWISWVALSTAILAVLAAIAGLLSGRYVNEAMMNQIEASDQWSYYQAKSIKAAVLDAKTSLGGASNESDQSKRDRYEKEQEEIKSKAELEIRHLHEKIDHLLRRQYNRLFEIQQIQIELLEEISRQKK